MPYRHGRHCPICFKPNLLSLSHHLSQVHQLSSEERQPWLKAAVFSATPCNGLAPYPCVEKQQYLMSSQLPQSSCRVVGPPSNRPLTDVHCLESQPYPEFTFQHMFSMMVVGPSQCGKTHFVQQLLTTNCIDFLEKKPMMVYWFYNQWQLSYEAIQRALKKKIRCAQGLPELKDDLSNINPARNNILVLDDLMSQATDSPVVSKLFTQGRHRNASVILLLQNMFPKGKYNTDISRNATYKVLFRSPGDRKQIDIMAEQTFAKDRPHFMKAYTQETETPYGYIVVDNHPRTTGKRQVVANVFGDCKSYPCSRGHLSVTDAWLEERPATPVGTTRSEPAAKQQKHPYEVNKQTTVTRQGSKKRKRVQSAVKKQPTTKKCKRVRSSVKNPSAKRSRKPTKTPTQKPKKPARTPRIPYQRWKTFQEADSEEGSEEEWGNPGEDHSEEDHSEDDPSEGEFTDENPSEGTWHYPSDQHQLNQLAAPSDEERDHSEGTWHYPSYQDRLIKLARPRPQGGFGPRCSYE